MKRFLTHVMVAALAAALAATWTAFAESGSGRDGSDDDGRTEVRQEDRRGDDGERRGRGDDDDDLFESRLAPSDPGDPTLNGVQPGGLPWVLRSGEAEIESNGKLEVKLRRLVIPEPQGDGTAGPVNTVTASLFCGDSTTPADESGARKLSDAGNARFKARLDLPEDCLAPTVFIHPNGDESRYIAVSGFKG